MEEELAAERVASVERQLHKHVPPGVRRNLLCPYCGSWNFPHTSMCCDLMRKAVIAVLMSDRLLKNAEIAEKAMQN